MIVGDELGWLDVCTLGLPDAIEFVILGFTDGDNVGSLVVGEELGDAVGLLVVGATEGTPDL